MWNAISSRIWTRVVVSISYDDNHYTTCTSIISLNLLCHSKTDARFVKGAPKAVWIIPYISVAFFPSLKQNFISYRSSEVSDCIFEIHQLWQSGFSRVYSNSCCSCSFGPEIIKNGQSSHNMYSNNILNFQGSATILNAHTKKVLKLIECTSYDLPYPSSYGLNSITTVLLEGYHWLRLNNPARDKDYQSSSMKFSTS